MDENQDLIVTGQREVEPTDRRIFERINDRLGQTDQACESEESLLDGEIPFCDIADKYHSGVRINPSNGNIEAEFTDRNGRVTYMNGNQVVEEAGDIVQRMRSASDNLTVSSPQDTAWLEQLTRGLSGMVELAQGAGLPVTWGRLNEIATGSPSTAATTTPTGIVNGQPFLPPNANLLSSPNQMAPPPMQP